MGRVKLTPARSCAGSENVGTLLNSPGLHPRGRPCRRTALGMEHDYLAQAHARPQAIEIVVHPSPVLVLRSRFPPSLDRDISHRITSRTLPHEPTRVNLTQR